jgi:hypothetical protein
VGFPAGEMFEWIDRAGRAMSFSRRSSSSGSTVMPDDKAEEIQPNEKVEALLQKLTAAQQKLADMTAAKARVSDLAFTAASDSHGKEKVRGSPPHRVSVQGVSSEHCFP